MKLLTNLKIKFKIFIVCSILLAMIAGVGMVSLSNMKSIQNNLIDIFAVRLPSIDYLIEADRDLQQLLVAERSMINVDPEDKLFSQLKDEYEKNFNQSLERWNKFKSLATAPSEKSIIAAHDSARTAWEASTRKVINELGKRTEDGRKRAMELSLGETSEKFEQMRDQMDKLTEINLNNAQLASDEAAATYSFAQKLLLTCVALGIILGLVFTWLVSTAIVTPLKAAILGLKDIAEGEGDLTKRLPTKSTDEVGELAHWFNSFLDKLQRLIKNIADNSDKVDTSSHSLASLATEINSDIGSLSSQADSVSRSADEMSHNATSVAAAMEEATSNLTMVSAATTEINTSVQDIAKNSEQAKTITSKAVEQTGSASDKVNELGKAAGEISKITEVITEISEQTNLLALNATIEAARAGEAGKGFAVVANEIKELAKQTATATLQIKKQIDGVQSSTSQTVTEIGQITEVIRKIDEIVSAIAIAVEEQSGVIQEISGNIDQASAGITEVNENVANNSHNSTEIARDIEEINSTSDKISTNSQKVNNSTKDLATLSNQLIELVRVFKV